LPELARGNAGIIAEKAGEMRGIGKSEACADLADGNVAMKHGLHRMADPRAIHIEQGDPAEIAVYDPQTRRHCCLQSGVALPGNELPLELIGNDREDEAEKRDGRADIPRPTRMVSTVRTCQAFFEL
jgi:hypothetical protein